MDAHEFSSRTMAGSLICASPDRPEDFLYFFSSHDMVIDDTSPESRNVTANGVGDGFIEIVYENEEAHTHGDGMERIADTSADIVTTEAIITADDIDIAEDIITREGCGRVRMDISPSKILRTYVP